MLKNNLLNVCTQGNTVVISWLKNKQAIKVWTHTWDSWHDLKRSEQQFRHCDRSHLLPDTSMSQGISTDARDPRGSDWAQVKIPIQGQIGGPRSDLHNTVRRHLSILLHVSRNYTQSEQTFKMNKMNFKKHHNIVKQLHIT